MFFKKSREEKQKAAETARAEIITGFETRLAEARAAADPAERLLKLAEVAEAADILSRKTNTELKAKAQSKWYAPYLGITGAGMGTAGALVAFLHLAAATFGAVVPLVFAAMGIGFYRTSRAEKKALAENKPLFDRLAGISDEARQDAQQVMRDHLHALSDSPKRDELLQRVPSLRDQFSEAFMKGDRGQPERRPQPAAGKTALQL
jgi:hypothetical protein